MKKIAVGTLLAMFVFVSLAEFIVSAQPAQAVPVEATILGSIPDQANKIFDMIKNGWKIAVLNAGQQAVAYFFRKVAYDSAVYLAAGGKGQSGLVFDQGFGEYLSQTGSQAAGTAIDQLGKGFGLDLCKIPDIKIDLAFRIGLHANFMTGGPKPPACDWAKFKENWGAKAWESKYGGGSGPLGFDQSKVFSESLSIDNTDLGISLKATEKIDRLVARQTESAKAGRLEGNGFKTVTNLIDGKVKQPSALVKQKAEANTPTAQNQRDQTQVAAAMGSGAYEILPSTLSLFLNTLAGQMLKNFKENGMLPGGLCVGALGLGDPSCKTQNSTSAQNPDSTGTEMSGRAAAEAMFSGLLVTKLDTINNYDILAELSSCDQRGLYNCRADSGLVQAITEDKNGVPVTIQEAMKNGWLKPEWKLLPHIGREAEDTNGKCYLDAFCESNLKVLRQLRIFPLGMEIAAAQSNPDHPDTLGDVVKGFYDCAVDSTGKVTYDPVGHRFCHLVDPNWVIKLPQARCDAKGYGPTPQGINIPDRIQECVDLKTCVGYNKDKTCAGYGNCVREKNVWRFDADDCDAQFATCKKFTGSSGAEVAYLYRTLDTGGCDQSTVGCQAYSLNQNSSGQWLPVTSTSNNANYSTGIYLNKNVSTGCSINSAGCSAYNVPNADTATIAYLKKAPDYLGCYDVNTSTAAIEWPQTFSDLTKMEQKKNPACDNYAQVCIADEVGCQRYTASDDQYALPITGKYTQYEVSSTNPAVVTDWHDECASQCVGYDAYKEMPSKWSPGNPLAYIVPPSSKYNAGVGDYLGKECKFEEVGCSSFTNMSTVQAGGEKVETYTDLRACVKPGSAQQKNFYIYESSDTGYKLQTYTLVADGLAPSTTFVTAAEKTVLEATCNETLYKSGEAAILSDGNCRQFNDDQGNVYYKLLNHTIVVSDQCTPYRLNSNELLSANTCFGNGEFKDGFCYYNGLPAGVAVGEEHSKTCVPEVVSCREYRGTASNVKQTILTEIFENQNTISSQNGWNVSSGNTSWSLESTQSGGHSLEYIGNGEISKNINLQIPTKHTNVGLSYALNFWIKGSAGQSALNVQILAIDGNNIPVVVGTTTANSSWQAFKFNFELPAGATTTLKKITFKLNNTGNLYLDNIQLAQVTDFLYLVKDSLSVDLACDSHPEDNLPGEALGCTAYADNNKTPAFLTNFSFLCRDGAVGCNAFTDTFNTISEAGPRAYNVRLSGTGGGQASINIKGNTFSCQVEVGKTSCLMNIHGYSKSDIEAAGGAFINSTYFVPADTSEDNPVYLVGNAQAQCPEVDFGCTYAGVQKSTPAGLVFETTTIKLLPDQFNEFTDVGGTHQGILCEKQAVGCGDFGGSFFKDPTVTGAKVCAWKTGVTDKNNNKVSGWFWKGVGVCGSSSTPPAIPTTATYCTSDTDCSAGSTYNTCVNKEAQACYPDYLQNGNEYGLWSYGDVNKYQNFVGECPSAQDACTEFIDHADIDSIGNPRSYWFIKNNKLSEDNCAGQVSQKAGCALFDDTSVLTKLYNTTASYEESNKYSFDKNQDDLSALSKVKPVTTGNKDANVIIKVKRDRECAEWLQCHDSYKIWDQNTQSFKQNCQLIGRCDKLPGGSINNCDHFINDNHGLNTTVLDKKQYVDRLVDWTGRDYAGLSILGLYPVETLNQYNIASLNSQSSKWVLAKPIACGSNCPPANQSANIYSCLNNNSACGDGGWCVNKICLKDVGGTTNGLQQDNAQGSICRGFPEKDSPFPNTSAIQSSQSFVGINKCSPQDGDSRKCQCDYAKITYGGGAIVKYFSDENNSKNFIGFCSGGDRDQQSCDPDCNNTTPVPDKCTNNNLVCKNGTCLAKDDKKNNYIGWQGYCLEVDKSRILNGDQNSSPCMSWLPIDSLAGVVDISENHPEAGLQIPANTAYCVAANLYKQRKTFDFYNHNEDGGPCVNVANATCPALGYSVASNYIGGANDECYIKCETLPYDNTNHPWVIFKSPVFGFDDFFLSNATDYNAGGFAKEAQVVSSTVGCSAYAQYDPSTFVGRTNVLWQGSKTKLSGIMPYDYDNRLNYEYLTPASPFGRIEPQTAGLISLDACVEKVPLAFNSINPAFSVTSPFGDFHSFIYSQPKADGSCITNHLTDKSKFKLDSLNALSYNPWYFQTISNCNNDAHCNIPHSCQGYSVQMKSYSSIVFDQGEYFPLKYYQDIIQKGQFPKFSGTTCKKVDTYVSSQCTRTDGIEVFDGNGNLDTNLSNLLNCYVEHNAYTCQGGCSAGGTNAGKICGNDDDCTEHLTCLKEGNVGRCIRDYPPYAQSITTLPIGNLQDPATQLQTDINRSQTTLSRLFSRVDTSPYVFSTSSQIYSQASIFAFDKRVNDGASFAPKVRPLGKCDSNNLCEELPQEGFNINDHYNSDVIIDSEPYYATAKFYFYADKDHMPITRLTINWDDGSPVYGKDGMYYNHRGGVVQEDGSLTKICTSEDKAGEFGLIEKGIDTIKTCDSHYVFSDHYYSCSKDISGDKYHTADECAKANPIWAEIHPNSGCCIYTPKIQVLDNWGWCNGTCGDGQSAGGTGCFNGYQVDPTNWFDECINSDPIVNKSYTIFGHAVLVAPNL